MNGKHIFVAGIMSLAAAGAMAQDIVVDYTAADDIVTRPFVRAMPKAHKAGEPLPAGGEYNPESNRHPIDASKGNAVHSPFRARHRVNETAPQ